MPSWPATLPKPLAAGYAITPQDQVLRTEMDTGSPRARRRSLAEIDRVSMSVLLSDEQFAIFKEWFNDPDEANAGASWFTISLAVGRGGMTTVEARFTAAYSATHAGKLRFNVSAELEVRYA